MFDTYQESAILRLLEFIISLFMFLLMEGWVGWVEGWMRRERVGWVKDWAGWVEG